MLVTRLSPRLAGCTTALDEREREERSRRRFLDYLSRTYHVAQVDVDRIAWRAARISGRKTSWTDVAEFCVAKVAAWAQARA